MGTKSVLSSFVKILEPYGFQKCGTQFVKIGNQIVFGLGFDRSRDSINCTVFVMPLYIPAKLSYYTFGERLQYIVRGPWKQYSCGFSDLERVQWLQRFEEVLNGEIIPFFQSISSPLDLLEFLNGNEITVQRFFFCPILEKNVYKYTLRFCCIRDKI